MKKRSRGPKTLIERKMQNKGFRKRYKRARRELKREVAVLSAKETRQAYANTLKDVIHLLESARRASARAVNTVMTATYWEIGRRIVELEQGGSRRAQYGEAVLESLSRDLSRRFGRGFSVRNLRQMRVFYIVWPIRQTASAVSGRATQFPLPWSHYVRLMQVENLQGRQFYEGEALRNGWSYRQLDRQIDSQFYERTALSRNKAAMLEKGSISRSGEMPTPEEELKDPFILEFLGLKDEYSESDLEEGLILKLEHLLLELGGDFAFIGRQRRLRVGDAWYRVDLLFFHRRLRCLVVVDLKIGKFTHADAGQMHLYLNYAKEHWTHDDENPPVGLILCAEKDSTVAKYALDGLPNKVLAAQYRTTLPKERTLELELSKTSTQLKHKVKRSK